MNEFDGDRVGRDALDWSTLECYVNEPQPFYAQVMLATVRQARLLADERLARRVVAALEATRDHAPGALWAYTVLPDNVRLIVGPTATAALDDYVEILKTEAAGRVLERICRADDDTLDMVLHYNPVWGAPLYRVWEAGFHLTAFTNEYRLSNAIYHMQQLPVAVGLVAHASEWPHTWVGGEV